MRASAQFRNVTSHQRIYRTTGGRSLRRSSINHESGEQYIIFGYLYTKRGYKILRKERKRKRGNALLYTKTKTHKTYGNHSQKTFQTPLNLMPFPIPDSWWCLDVALIPNHRSAEVSCGVALTECARFAYVVRTPHQISKRGSQARCSREAQRERRFA